jgi:hypothetical protein
MSGDEDPREIVKAGAATARFSAGAARISVTLPYAWMIRGYVHAVRRYDAASQTNARDLCIALFEATTWLDSLRQRGGLTCDDDLAALQYVRIRTHHQWAAAVYFDREQGTWVWYPASNFPSPNERQHPKLEARYERRLAGKPVRDVLSRIEARVIALDPDAEL